MSKYEKPYELKGSFITPTADGVLLIRQATERGVIECIEGGCLMHLTHHLLIVEAESKAIFVALGALQPESHKYIFTNH